MSDADGSAPAAPAAIERVVTVANIEARSKALQKTCDEVEELVRHGALPCLAMTLRFKDTHYGSLGANDPVGGVVFSMYKMQRTLRYPVLASVLEHAHFETRFYMSFPDAPVVKPKYWKDLPTYFEQLNAFANRAVDEDLTPRMRAKVLESISEAQLEFEVQLGKFHLQMLDDGGEARVQELVDTVNSALQEIGGLTHGIDVRKR